MLPAETRYVTLSHCWGKVWPIRLLRENLEQLGAGIALDDLPKTFRDAVYVAWRLGVRYLWIYSLCIVQDSDEDWKRESTKMMDVYLGGFCNISATSAQDARDGLFHDRDTVVSRATILEIPSPDILLQQLIQESFMFLPGNYTVEAARLFDLPDSPLLKRAWVLQEQLLAKRTLHFHSKQILFECEECIVSELFTSKSIISLRKTRLKVGPSVHDLSKSHGRLKMVYKDEDACQSNSVCHQTTLDKVLDGWQSIMESYTSLNLTFETDRQVAIRGIASLYKPAFQCKYIAGIWNYRLESQLIWRSTGGHRRPIAPKAPSWSWASSRCGVSYRDWNSNLILTPSLFEVLNTEVSAADQDELSPVEEGSLSVKGKLIPISLDRRQEASPKRSWEIPGAVILRGKQLPIIPDMPLKEVIGRCYYLPVCSTNKGWARTLGLVLESLQETKGQFRRVGYGEIEDEVLRRTPTQHWIYERGDAGEKSQMTQELYELYEEDTDLYTFKIV